MGLVETFAFLREAAARSLHGGAPSLYSLSGGRAHAWGSNSVALASHPCPTLLGEFSVDADLLDAALGRLGAEPSVSSGDGTLVLRVGRRSVELDLMDPVGVDAPPEGEWAPGPRGRARRGRGRRRVTAKEGTWQTGVLVADRVAAFNGKAAVEVDVDGLDAPPFILPAEAARYLTSRAEAPVEWSRSGGVLSLRWLSGALVAVRLVSGEWPDTVRRALDAVGDDAPVPITDDLREAIGDVAHLGDGTVVLRPEGVTGGRQGSKVSVEIESPVKRVTEWSKDVLAPVVAVADRWDPDSERGVARFYGPRLRGVVAGIRR